MLGDPQFWLALGQVILLNVVLSADNAIVIALAVRALPAHQQRQAVAYGTVAVIAVRIALTLLAAALLDWPGLRIAGALLLGWIAVKLLLPQDNDAPVAGERRVIGAIKTILIADVVMSVDNVFAVAAAAGGNSLALIMGLVLSIPLVVFCATLLARLMTRWPVIIFVGAALLGWVAGDLLITDTLWSAWFSAPSGWAKVELGTAFGYPVKFHWLQVAAAALVLAAGAIARKKAVAGAAR